MSATRSRTRAPMPTAHLAHATQNVEGGLAFRFVRPTDVGHKTPSITASKVAGLQVVLTNILRDYKRCEFVFSTHTCPAASPPSGTALTHFHSMSGCATSACFGHGADSVRAQRQVCVVRVTASQWNPPCTRAHTHSHTYRTHTVNAHAGRTRPLQERRYPTRSTTAQPQQRTSRNGDTTQGSHGHHCNQDACHGSHWLPEGGGNAHSCSFTVVVESMLLTHGTPLARSTDHQIPEVDRDSDEESKP